MRQVHYRDIIAGYACFDRNSNWFGGFCPTILITGT